MHINAIDLNLLRVFDAIYSTRNVSRAAERLGLTQPAASQGLTRLRLLLGDALFVRAPGGVAPTPRAERLAVAVQQALATLEQALGEASQFDPAASGKTFRMHLSDIGEARFLPPLMADLHQRAPGVRLESSPWPHEQIAEALDSGAIDFALGYLPSVANTQNTQRAQVLQDRYSILLRAGHPLLARQQSGQTLALADLRQLDFVAVRSHAQTLRILQLLKLDGQVRLTAAHFLALPSIVRESDLAVLMPLNIARGFVAAGGYAIAEPDMPARDFTVSLHWSRRFETDPGNVWLRQRLLALFADMGENPV
nr:LysR substrate-binding domain-containing protein [uncultured Albidiferax sp.]